MRVFPFSRTVEDAAVELIGAAARFERARREIDDTVAELEERWAVNRSARQSLKCRDESLELMALARTDQNQTAQAQYMQS